MELMLRCEVPNRPGALATLAGVVAEAGGDIQAVDVVESGSRAALDDLVVVVDGPAQAADLIARLRALPDVVLVHAGPSRGHPGDAVIRLALGLESVLNGAMTLEHGLQALVGGLLRATHAEVVDAADAPQPGDTLLVLPFDGRALVIGREYRLTDTERERAAAILRAALEAMHTRTPSH